MWQRERRAGSSLIFRFLLPPSSFSRPTFLAAIYRVGGSRVGQMSGWGSRELDPRPKGRASREANESMEQAGERDGRRVEDGRRSV